MFNIDSWLWKVALVLAIVGVREFVRQMNGGAQQRAVAEAAQQPGGAHSVRTDNMAAGDGDENARWIIETLDSMAIAIGLVLFVVQPFLLQAFWIPSGSMEDTLQWKPVGDRLLVSKFVYRVRPPRSGDVVVFEPPSQAEAAPGDDFIKRCIGAPGDIVYARNRRYWRNGRQLVEPYVKWSSPSNSYDMKIVDGKVYSREYDNSVSFSTMAPWVEAGPGPISSRMPYLRQDYIENAPPEAVPPDRFLMLGDHRDNSNDSHAWGLVSRENIVGKAFCVFWPPSRAGLIDNMSRFPRPLMPRKPPAQLSPVAQ